MMDRSAVRPRVVLTNPFSTTIIQLLCIAFDDDIQIPSGQSGRMWNSWVWSENCIGGNLFNNKFSNKLHASQTLYSKGEGKRK